MGKARKYFERWYRTKEAGLAAGLQDMRLIAKAAFNQGVAYSKKPCNTAIHIDTKPDCPSCDFNRNEEIANYCEVCGKALR